VNTTKFPKAGKNFSIKAKVRLAQLELSIEALAGALKPRRPRSTVSTAIHTDRFPRVREQVKEALGL
jgi:hypothetical protein